MFWVGIMGRELVGPFSVPEGVKMPSAMHPEFLTFFFSLSSMVQKEEPCLP